MDSQKDFFISYTRADKQWAEWIAWILEAEGYTTILQAWDFHSGHNFVVKMDEATRLAKRTIVVLSADYFASRFTPAEWTAAFHRDPKGEKGILIPVRVQPYKAEGLFASIAYIDLVGLDRTQAKKALLKGLQWTRNPLKRNKPDRELDFPM
jgi:hypothetical protein